MRQVRQRHALYLSQLIPVCLRLGWVEALRRGVHLSGSLGVSAPAEVERVGQEVSTTWVRITISEGKNRQVWRAVEIERSRDRCRGRGAEGREVEL